MPGFYAMQKGPHGEDVGFSKVGGAPFSINVAHGELHEGNFYHVHKTATLNSTNTLEMRIAPANGMTECHLVIRMQSSLAATLQVYEGTGKTHAAANAITPTNRNRNSKSASVATVCHTPDGSGDGTEILAFVCGTGGALTGAGGDRSDGQEIILKRNTAYLVRVTSGSNTNPVNISLEWYEERTETYTTTTTSTTSTSSTTTTAA